jgi:hypothetical protein
MSQAREPSSADEPAPAPSDQVPTPDRAPAPDQEPPPDQARPPAGQAPAPEQAPLPGETEAEQEARLKGMPEYKGEPLDAERGPGLGCFWIQIALLTFFLIFTPLTVTWGWDPFISGALLIFTLILLLFSGQTIIFLLRLVAADRRTRRTPLDPGARRTVGQLEDAGTNASDTLGDEAGQPTDADAAPEAAKPEEGAQ